MTKTISALLAFIPLVFTFAVHAQDKPYSPYVGQNFPINVYFGDTHLHTNISFDAYGDGNINMGPDEAYRFAKGEQLKGHDGQPVRMSRPLDFLVIADHAEYMAIVQGVSERNKLLTATEAGARWSKMAQEKGGLLRVFGEMVNDGATNQPRDLGSGFAKSVWQGVGEAAERHNDPGRFTAFIGYEYSSLPEGDNLHRVVVFRDGPEKTNQTVPFSLFDSENPEDLWKYMATYEAKTGGRVFSIPHNGNLSAGRMFSTKDFKGKPFTRKYAEMRAKWEEMEHCKRWTHLIIW